MNNNEVYEVSLNSEEETVKFEKRVELFSAKALQAILANGASNLTTSENATSSIIIQTAELAADYGANLAIALAKRGY